MHGDSANWSHVIIDEPDGSCRVEVTDEDGELFPVARKVTRGQAALLIHRVTEESRTSRRPIKTVIRDPYFMAATIITLKRQPL